MSGSKTWLRNTLSGSSYHKQKRCSIRLLSICNEENPTLNYSGKQTNTPLPPTKHLKILLVPPPPSLTFFCSPRALSTTVPFVPSAYASAAVRILHIRSLKQKKTCSSTICNLENSDNDNKALFTFAVFITFKDSNG